MYFLYSLGFFLWILLNLPVFIFQALVHKKYIRSLRQRLGHLPPELAHDGRATIWLHACSLGETLSAQPLAFLLRQRFPAARIVLSTITLTGQTVARQRFAEYDGVFYFPFDWSPVVRRVLNHVRPALMVILETEIWPNFLRECRARRIPVVTVNGRISARAFRRYRLVARFLRRVFEAYALFIMKAEEDAERIKAMGAPPQKVVVSGNIKFDRDVVEKEVREIQGLALDQALGLTAAGTFLIVGGSTHAGEEQILLEVLGRVRQEPGLEKTRLLLVPRHPERFARVAELAERAGFRVQRRSDAQAPAEGADVLVLDTIGELAAAYRFATVAFVGGSLIPHGGQSILEPALFAKPIVTGPSQESFPGIIDGFLARGAVRQITATKPPAQVQQLTEEFVRLLTDGPARAALGTAAFSVLQENKGATKFTADRIAPIYEQALRAVRWQASGVRD